MDNIYIILIFAIGVIIAIGIGLEISKGIDETVISLLFWFLYIITFITLINIVLVINYYLTMRNKTGPHGSQGNQGEQGDKGEAGKCDADCRDKYCSTRLLNPKNGIIPTKLRELNQGVSVDVNNIYIKSKVNQMCSSDEFKQLAPYNGPNNLVSYLESIWKIWIEDIYKSGGALFFQTIGAEEQFKWQAENPFDEIKKYDVFYWGMGRQYRPKIVEKCYASRNGETPDPNFKDSITFKVSKTDMYDFIGNDQGSRSNQDATFWRPKQYTYKGTVFYPVGDIVMGPIRGYNDYYKRERHVGIIKYHLPLDGPLRETIIVAGDVKGPVNYELLWSNTISGNKFWVWRPIAPSNYIALGDVITTTNTPPGTNENAPIRCVPFDTVEKLPTNGQWLWSSAGTREPTNFFMMGFRPNNNKYVNAEGANAYNLFRGVSGWNAFIPDSDINGSFYYINPERYDQYFQIGKLENVPGTNDYNNRVGKGILPSEQVDSKYSVLAYLQLKNQPILTHQKSTTQLYGKIIENAIGGTYTLSVNGDNKCLSVKNGAINMELCDNDSDSQYFTILFTGNIKNECRIKHKSSDKYLKYKNGAFSLQKTNDNTDSEYLIFIMS
jgi:hypothetical protein